MTALCGAHMLLHKEINTAVMVLRFRYSSGPCVGLADAKGFGRLTYRAPGTFQSMRQLDYSIRVTPFHWPCTGQLVCTNYHSR